VAEPRPLGERLVPEPALEPMNAAARLAGACLALALGLTPQDALAQQSEQSVKAAFLYRFAAYVEWPAAVPTDAPFVIATLGADDVAAELSSMLPGRAVAGRPAVLRTVKEGESLQGVQMLFIGKRATDPRAAIRAAHERGILTVTEVGLEAGGVINFVVAENRVAFEVSLEAAERSGHRISSRMLAVARRVVPKGAV
jgi:hypothetical protein